jgi:hypothetical protein
MVCDQFDPITHVGNLISKFSTEKETFGRHLFLYTTLFYNQVLNLNYMTELYLSFVICKLKFLQVTPKLLCNTLPPSDNAFLWHYVSQENLNNF